MLFAIAALFLLATVAAPSASAEPEECQTIQQGVHYYLPFGTMTTAGGDMAIFKATQMVSANDWIGDLITICA